MRKSTSYSQGKRRKIADRKLNKKKVFITVLIFLLLIVTIVYFVYQKYSISDNQEEVDEVINIEENEDSNDEIIDEEEETSNDEMPDEIGGYRVIGKLVIEKLGIEKEILYKTDKNSLDLSVTKFYGPNINEKGNFCITGHNYANMLKKVIDGLEKGDTFYLINKENKSKQTYKIFDIYTCSPTDLKCLDSVYPNKREVTLITCNPGGVTRLIIKALEV